MGYRGKSWLLGTAATAAIVWSGAARAEDAQFNIAPQPLASALNEFSLQSRQSVLFTTDLAAARSTRGVSGQVEVADALSALLAGTGLTYRKNGDTFLVVRADAAPQSGSAEGDGAEVEALIVTAQKREEDIQDVPIAISAFTQEALERSQIAGGPDLITQVPNMTFTKTNFSSYSVQLRGIGTQAISATVDPAVAVAFNNTPFIRNRFFEQEFYDLQRLEVLRGPQGTLYGRNATAGVVNIISQKPSYRYEARVSGDVANYSSTRLEGMINLPIVEDMVAVRLAGAWTKREGYSTNQITGNPIDGRDLWSTRLSLRFEPTDAISANLIWEHFEEDDDRLRSGKQLCKKDLRSEIGGLPMPPHGGLGLQDASSVYSQGCIPASLYAEESFQTPNGYSLPYYHGLSQIGLPVIENLDIYMSTTQSRDLRVIESTWDPEYRADTDIGQLQVNADLTPNLTFSSETAYLADSIYSLQDYNRFNTQPGVFGDLWLYREGVLSDDGVFCDPQLGCSNRVIAVDVSTAESTQFAQEFRLSSDFDGRLNVNLGANFLRYDTEEKYYVFINTLTLVSTVGLANSESAPPYAPGETENLHCLPKGYVAADPLVVQPIPSPTVKGCTYIDPNPIGSVNDLGHNYFLSKNPYRLISYAAFGEVYYNITPALKLTGGLRWTVDKKRSPTIPSWLLAASGVGYPVAGVVTQEWREPTGRLTLDWKPELSFTDETLLYGTLARGYKAGGANPPPAVAIMYGGETGLGGTGQSVRESMVHPLTFDPEYVDSIEAGAKNVFADGAATLNTSAFYYDYRGYQISEIVDRAAVTHNYDAEVWGLELESDLRPVENFRLGLKLGYLNTRMANGMEAIDLMDRTAGNPDWVVARPFPTVPSNCIIPVSVATATGGVYVPGNIFFQLPNPGPCLYAYHANLDPVTLFPYVPNPQWWHASTFDSEMRPIEGSAFEGYAGFDPSTAPNNGEGFAKDLGGNELPNAPHFTATLSADYTIPLSNDWLMTLHTDVYYQSEAWTRIFNMEGYDKLKAYTNVNLAAIFTNEDAGWKVMAYVKNVLDRDSITGAFLNSDDTGLTTNVFLTEPRLYGLRVTKEWTGGGFWSGAGANHTPGEPYPLTVELGGMLQRQDAAYAAVSPSFGDRLPATLSADSMFSNDLDWGNSGELTLTYRPKTRPWSVSGRLKFGRANSAGQFHADEFGEVGCKVAPKYGINRCELAPLYPELAHYILLTGYNHMDASAHTVEDHQIVDFVVGREVGLGENVGVASTISAGLRYATFKSRTEAKFYGVGEWDIPQYWANLKYNVYHTRFDADLTANRKFEGTGPIITWDGARRVLEGPRTGHLDLDWALTGGVLFGKQTVSTDGDATATEIGQTKYTQLPPEVTIFPTPHRTRDATVPLLELNLGLSYEVERFKASAGYRWERYFDAIDGGYEEHKSYDRTIDGPYFKVAVGFGG